MTSDTRMVAVGFGKFARADRIFALERITGEERGDGRRTRVWIDGVADPLIASRTEPTILRDMGQDAVIAGPELDEALDLAQRLQPQRTRDGSTSTTSAAGLDGCWPRLLRRLRRLAPATGRAQRSSISPGVVLARAQVPILEGQ